MNLTNILTYKCLNLIKKKEKKNESLNDRKIYNAPLQIEPLSSIKFIYYGR